MSIRGDVGVNLPFLVMLNRTKPSGCARGLCPLLTSTLWVAGYLSSKPNWRLRSVFHCDDGFTVGDARIRISMANTVFVSTSTITLLESRQSPLDPFGKLSPGFGLPTPAARHSPESPWSKSPFSLRIGPAHPAR